MYAYTSGSCSGSPHSSHSVTVSGSDGSRIEFSASTNGTCATIPAKADGARLATAPMSSPPADPPRQPGERGAGGDRVPLTCLSVEQARRGPVARRALPADERDRHPRPVRSDRPLAVLLVVSGGERNAGRRRQHR